jgi:hypothetical protein
MTTSGLQQALRGSPERRPLDAFDAPENVHYCLIDSLGYTRFPQAGIGRVVDHLASDIGIERAEM